MSLRIFELCKRYANKSDHVQHRIGSCVVKKGKIVSFGWNQRKTHSKSLHPYRNLHAETHAILSTKEDLTGASIYVFRENRQGRLACSKPCKYCEEMIRSKGIKKIYYTDYDAYREVLL